VKVRVVEGDMGLTTTMDATFDYIKKLDAARDAVIKHFPGRPAPSWVRVTTITMCSKFIQTIDLAKFKENFAKMGSITVRRKGSKFRGFEWKLKDTAFYNQVTIGYQDQYSRKSVKLFPNGSIQVAGCADFIDCKRIMKQLSFILGIVLDLEKEVPIGDISISMINTNFSLNASVNLRAVIGKFSNNMFKVTFDPDRYSAVKIKFAPAPGMKQVTASVFSTGRIIVTGAQTLDEIARSYEIINRTITTDALVKPVATPELFDVILGAKFKEWVEILTK